MTIEELYRHKMTGNDKWGDLCPRMPDLRRYAGFCKRIVEFGTRTGNSTAAFLAGGAEVWSYDVSEHEFDCPEAVKDHWHFTKANTAQLENIPDCDLLFIDSLHTETQVSAELRMAPFARMVMFHDVKEWGWVGDSAPRGILPAIFRFLAQNKEWRVREILDDDTWGLLIIER